MLLCRMGESAQNREFEDVETVCAGSVVDTGRGVKGRRNGRGLEAVNSAVWEVMVWAEPVEELLLARGRGCNVGSL